MKSFLKELAEQIYKEHPQLDRLTLVFPNRRAALYFQKHLSSILSKPAFAPRLITIEDFISGFSALRVPDKLELIHRLHKTYQAVVLTGKGDRPPEPFDQFYFWGDMLLRDFDEVDKYLVNAGQLFKDLRNQKELDSSFDYLTEQQREFLKSFWSNFEENLTDNKRKFLDVWSRLFLLYKTFRQELKSEGLAYEGMLHREVAEYFASGEGKGQSPKELKFVGFNALTKSEEKILSHFVHQGSKMYWDGDEYYVNSDQQEAGRFLREYQLHTVLKETFPPAFPSNLRQPKSIRVFGAAQPIGQAKLMSQVLHDELQKGIIPEDTLIVLPDEKLLMPVLHGISGSVEKLNVTMGFALSSTPLFNLVELLIELQIGIRKDQFSHRHVLAILGHPYVVAADTVAANTKRKEILLFNWVYVSQDFLGTAVELHRMIFSKSERNTLHYLTSIVNEIGKLETISTLDKEYAFQFLKLLNRISEVLNSAEESKQVTAGKEGDIKERNKALKSFQRLLRQLVRTQKIPFTGEPLAGLQVMGVLETRNLDFKNVFILSMNEGAFPAFGGKGSYVPFNIRKAYDLPTVEHQDAMYAYLFYRVLQRAENIFLFHNSETDDLGQGEMSRYLQQLIYESGLNIEREILHDPIKPVPVKPIRIQKDAHVLEALTKLNSDTARFRGISPSGLNSYIECKLKFYFRYVARIKEPKEVEGLDARMLGNILHKVMESFYKNLFERKNNKEVEAGDFVEIDTNLDHLIDNTFKDTYRLEPGKKVEYEGQQLVVKEVVKSFARQIMKADRKYAPFVMEAVELEGLLYTVKIGHAPGYAVVGGKIDRVDRKGNDVRIIDYKTGKDELDFNSVASLFMREEKRNKAAFQTLVYALLYKTTREFSADTNLIPGLISRANLFEDAFKFGLIIGKEPVTDVNSILPEFEIYLKTLLEDIYNPDEVFEQTTLIETCKFCPYRSICYR
ncbi:MAG: PD-(D/E)XK nuclease family protein [Bacteroidota bacterium]|mgnify:CR=1 FL=1